MLEKFSQIEFPLHLSGIVDLLRAKWLKKYKAFKKDHIVYLLEKSVYSKCDILLDLKGISICLLDFLPTCFQLRNAFAVRIGCLERKEVCECLT